MTKRAVLYARVSGDDTRKEGRNLASQLEMGREYAQQKGYEIVAELAEDERGASGASFDLEQLDRALEMARAGHFDVLVVRELDRFARSLAKQLIVEGELKRAGVSIDYVLGEYPDTPEGNLMKNVRAVVAEYERLKIAERSTRGLRNIAKSGKVMLHGNRPPYGYRLTDDGTLVVHEPEAKVVRMVYDWYVHGDEAGEKMSMIKIADRLSEMGVPTWEDIHDLTGNKVRGRGTWTHSTIAKMLHKETYKGVWHYGKGNGTTGEANPREQWIAVDVPAIVSPELWRAAQQQAKSNRTNAKRNVKHEYLMRYRLTCACGYKVTSEHSSRTLKDGTRRHYLYYRCSGRYGNVRTCALPTFPARRVDALVWEWVREWLLNPEQLTQELHMRQQERAQDHAPLRERLSVIDDLIADNEAQLARLLDLYLGGDFPKELLMRRRAELERTTEALENERAKLAATLEVQTLTDDQIATIADFGAEIRAHLEGGEADFDRRRRVIEMLDVRGVLAYENEQKVVYLESTMAGLSGKLDCRLRPLLLRVVFTTDNRLPSSPITCKMPGRVAWAS